MSIFGRARLLVTKAIRTVSGSAGQLQAVFDRGWVRILESWAGAWQHNVEITLDNVTSHPAIFACVTLIANDIGKMHLRLVQQNADGIWNEITNPAYTPVLRKPNHFQNRIQFVVWWCISKLLHGNTYALKVRDARGVVQGLYLLDPQRVRPLVSPRGDVFYELKRDDLSQLPQTDGYVVPASEIIHDHWNELFHPLVGLSPIYACGLVAVQGLNILHNSTFFFGNGSNPGGVIEVPGDISNEVADRLKARWDEGFSGENAGKVAILANGMKYTQMKVSAVDSQVVEQLKWGAEVICAVFHVPASKAGFAPPPGHDNVEALDQQYYSAALQILIESIEQCLDDGLGLTTGDVAAQKYGTEFDIDDLLRMDSARMIDTLGKGVLSALFKPNEARKKLNLPPVPGGDSPYLQQQNYSLEALNKRDQQPDPFATTPARSALPPAADEEPEDEALDSDVTAMLVQGLLTKELAA